MKKIIILSALFVSISINSHAAGRRGRGGDDQQGFNFGGSLGVNGSFIMHQYTYGAKELPYASTVRFAVGGNVGYNFTQHVGVELELNYSGQGQNYKDDVGNPPLQRQISLTYLQFPVMFKYNAGDAGTGFFVMAGPQFGFLLNSSISYNGAEQLSTQTSGFFVSHDIGIKLVVGDNIRLTDQLYLSAGVNFNLGFTDINLPAIRYYNLPHPYHASNNAFGGLVIGIHYKLR